MAVLGLRFCARAFSSCGKRGPLFIVVCGPLTITASLAAEHRLQTRRLSNCGSRAQLLRGMWDLPRPGLEPMSPALAGRLSTTAPPGKPGNPISVELTGSFSMPTAFNLGTPEAFPFFYYEAFPLLCLPFSLPKCKRWRPTPLLQQAQNKWPFLILIWLVFTYFCRIWGRQLTQTVSGEQTVGYCSHLHRGLNPAELVTYSCLFVFHFVFSGRSREGPGPRT